MANDAGGAPTEGAQEKTCTKCSETKPLSGFYRNKKSEDRLRSRCKECDRAQQAAYNAAYRVANTDKLKAAKAAYRAANPDKVQAYGAEWRAANPEKVKANDVAYRAANADKAKARQVAWRDANPDKVRARSARRREDPKYRVESSIRGAIHKSITRGSKSKRTFDLLGYTSEQLMAHLEKQFADGMSWENYGPVWHIDHKIPLAVHNYETPDHADFKQAWALSNLQPMWAFDNISKGAKLPADFQPSLAL